MINITLKSKEASTVRRYPVFGLLRPERKLVLIHQIIKRPNLQELHQVDKNCPNILMGMVDLVFHLEAFDKTFKPENHDFCYYQEPGTNDMNAALLSEIMLIEPIYQTEEP